MIDLLTLAAKSLLIAGATLVLLRLIRRRSAADRSFVAHIGLAALALLPLAMLLLPRLTIETALVPAGPSLQPAVPAAMLPATTEASSSAAMFPGASVPAAAASVDWPFWAYAVPAGLLLLLTLIALARLVALKSRATVLVEPHWLTALARAQRRMGFKHGTALLTSNALSSPISWGLMRPVILLNDDAANARGEAEAIIAHELAHVAGRDWLKLLLSRVTVAIFWFNPLVWLLAREAHQLREEAADDAVLASDVEDTDYARLLVGIARHECRGLLIGAHGVAPARGSLARRVARVLDTRSVRGPVARSFAAGVFVGAAALAAPLAAVTLSADAAAEDRLSDRPAASSPAAVAEAAAVPSAVEGAAGTAVAAAAAANGAPPTGADPHGLADETDGGDPNVDIRGPDGATIVTNRNGETILRSPNGARIVISRPGPDGLQKVVMRSANGSVQTFADARTAPGVQGFLVGPKHKVKVRAGRDDAIDTAIEMKAVGLTPAYAAAIRAAAPHLRLSTDELIEMKAVGVSPELIRDLAAAGFSRASADDLVAARAVGVTSGYIRAMNAVGVRGSTIDDYVEMRAVGVTPDFAERFRRRGIRVTSTDQLVKLKVHGVEPGDVVRTPPPPPSPPPAVLPSG